MHLAWIGKSVLYLHDNIGLWDGQCDNLDVIKSDIRAVDSVVLSVVVDEGWYTMDKADRMMGR